MWCQLVDVVDWSKCLGAIALEVVEHRRFVVFLTSSREPRRLEAGILRVVADKASLVGASILLALRYNAAILAELVSYERLTVYEYTDLLDLIYLLHDPRLYVMDVLIIYSIPLYLVLGSHGVEEGLKLLAYLSSMLKRVSSELGLGVLLLVYGVEVPSHIAGYGDIVVVHDPETWECKLVGCTGHADANTS